MKELFDVAENETRSDCLIACQESLISASQEHAHYVENYAFMLFTCFQHQFKSARFKVKCDPRHGKRAR